jgi:hypothetical protein
MRRLSKDERGISNMLVGFGMVGFILSTTLALDAGMWMAARSMAQNSADAGALAGAVALVYDDFEDRSPTGPAVQSAVNTSRENDVMYSDVVVGPGDVSFPLSPTGQNNRVRVQVARTINSVFGGLFGRPSMDIRAMAVAEASPANAARCLLPFMLPDRWTETTAPPWTEESTFDMYDKKGNPLNPQDHYVSGAGEDSTGYLAERDKGDFIVLKTDNTGKVSPSIYNPWAIPGSTGADDYREAIAGCRTGLMSTGYEMTPEPGNMVGPTVQGIEELVAQDSGAYWNEGCNCVKGSRFGVSPRIRPIPLYDPVYYENGKQNGRTADFKMVGFLGVFVVGMQGNQVIARIHPITAEVTGDGVTESSFAMAIRLVE